MIVRSARGDVGEAHALARRGCGLILGDEAGVDHIGEDLLGPRGSAFPVARRAKLGRRFEQTGDDRRFVEGDLAGGLAEIAMRRSIDAIGAGAEIDAVEIDLEQLLLGEFVLEPECELHLLDLAPEGPLGREEEILGELLRDGAAALDDMAGTHVDDGGAEQTEEIDAEMAVEAPILRGDDRVGQIFRHVAHADGVAKEIAVGGQQSAVARYQGDARSPLGVRQIASLRQGQGEIAEEGAERDDTPDRENDPPAQRRPAETPPPAGRATRLAGRTADGGARGPTRRRGNLPAILRIETQLAMPYAHRVHMSARRDIGNSGSRQPHRSEIIERNLSHLAIGRGRPARAKKASNSGFFVATAVTCA